MLSLFNGKSVNQLYTLCRVSYLGHLLQNNMTLTLDRFNTDNTERTKLCIRAVICCHALPLRFYYII